MRLLPAGLAALLFQSALAAGPASGAPRSEWTVESADSRGLVLLWQDVSPGKPGGPSVRTAAIGLPQGARPTASVEALADAEGRPAGGIRSLQSAGNAALSSPMRYRDLEVASLSLDPAAGGRRISRARVRVDFRAAGASRPAFAPPADQSVERHLQGWILNYAQSRAFRGQPANPLAKAAAGPAAGASLPRVRLVIKTAGENVEVLDYAALKKAGVPLGSIDPRLMRLWRAGVEVPMHIHGGDDGRWDPQDHIEFVGASPGGDRTRLSLFVSTAAFLLTWEGGRMGLRAPAVPVAARGQDLMSGNPAGIREAPPFKALVHQEEDLEILRIGSTSAEEIVDLGARVEESELTDFWMWRRQGPDKDATEIPFNLDHEPVPLGKGAGLKSVPLRIRIHLKGITNNPKANPDHHVKFILNGKDISLVEGMVNDAIWEGQDSHTWVSRDLDPSVLKAGRNVLVIQKVNDLKANDGTPVEVQDAYLNWFQLEFPSAYKAQGDQLRFSNDFEDSLGVRLFNLSGFTAPDVSVWDLRGRKLTGYRVTRRGSAYDIAFTDSLAGPTRYIAAALSKREVPRIALDTLPDLVNPTDGADWLAVTHRDLLGSGLDSLIGHRRKQGLRCKVVLADHIYQAFGDGSMDPAAIRRFVEHAYRTWPRPAPAYLALIGETSLWYEKRGGELQKTLVPTQLVNIHGWGVAANDDYFAKVSGEDPLPDLFVGRIPAATKGDLSKVVRKTLALENRRPAGHWANKALLISGFEESFALQNGRLQALAASHDRQWSRLDLYPQSPHYKSAGQRSDFFDQMDSGFSVVSFIGHGGGAVWSDAGVLTLRHLDEGRLKGEWPIPLVSSITCLTGYFEDVGARSLGEEMIRLERGGAAAFYGAAGYISNLAGEALSYEVIDAVASGSPTAGAAIHRAETMVQLKTAGAFAPILSEFNLLGDPALRFNPPSAAGALALDPDLQVAGTTLSVKGTGLSPAKAEGVLTLLLGDSSLGATAVSVADGAFSLQRNLGGLTGLGPVPEGKALLHYWSGQESRVAKASFTTLDWLIDSVRMEPATAAPGDSVTLHLRLATAYANLGIDGGVAFFVVSGENPASFPDDNVLPLRVGENGRLSTARLAIPVPGPDLAMPRLYVAFRLTARVLDADGNTVRSIGNLSSRPYALPVSALARLSFAEPAFRVPVQDSLGVWAVFRNGGLGRAEGFSVVLTRDAEGAAPETDSVAYGESLELGGTDSVFFRLADSLLSGKRLRVTLKPAREGELADRGTVKDTVFRMWTRKLAQGDSLRLDSASWLALPAGGKPLRAFAERVLVASLPAHLSPAQGGLPAEAWRIRSASPEPGRLVVGARHPSAAPDRPFWHFQVEGSGARPWLKLDTAGAGPPWTGVTWKSGLYGNFFNRDVSAPLVQFSSRGQALLQDDYVPRNTPINVVVRDAEGVDMALRPPSLASRRQATDSSTLAVEAGAASPTMVRFNFLARHGAAQDSLEVTATDVSGNVTRKTLAYRHGEDLTIRNLGSYPNPFADTAIFVYSLTDYCEKVQLKVYSRAGRLVRSLEERNVVGYREVVWDGRAESGAAIGNGLYFLKVTARAGDQEATKVFKLFKKRRK